MGEVLSHQINESTAVLVPRSRTLYMIGILSYCTVVVREVAFRSADPSLAPSLALLGAILLLLLTDPLLFRLLRWYRYPYFALQTTLIQSLGLLSPHLDVWGILYLLVAPQARYHLPPKPAIAWGGLSTILLLLTLVLTEQRAYGLGLGLGYVAASILVVSWELFSNQAEAARRASDSLLVEMQQAQQKLEAHAARVEEEAAARERDRIAHQLHDSVGQSIFGISLTVESARLLLRKDPARVPEEIERLQELTSSALGQMRSLITQWRPG